MTTALSKLAAGLKYSSILAKAAVMQNWNEAASRRYLLDSLGSMPGVSAKAAQFLAMKLGEDQNRNPVRVEPMPISWVKAQIASAAPQLHEDLMEIGDDPVVASLGQVHVGRLRSGESVAIKVQFPGLKKSFAEQLGLLRQVSKAGPPRKFRFEMDAILDYFAQSLLREIDYREEARQQTEAARLLPPHQLIRIARVYSEYSSDTILTQSYEPSTSLAHVKQSWPLDARRDCAVILLDYFLHAVFCAHSVHTDPHPGNLGFRPAARPGADCELVLYDFGSTMQLDHAQPAALWSLMQAHQTHQAVVPFDHLVAMGFDSQKLLPMADRLPALMERWLAPFCQDGDFDFRQWNLKEHFERVLGEDRWWFRSAGPPWFLMLMRATQGLVHALCELGVAVPVKQRLLALNLPPASLVIAPVLAILHGEPGVNPTTAAKKLLVAVSDEKGAAIVRLEFPVHAVEELEHLVPEETVDRMKEQHIDIAAIKRRAMQSAYAPQVLFELKTNLRSYRVWLQ